MAPVATVTAHQLKHHPNQSAGASLIPRKVSLCSKTAIKARAEAGLGEIPAREASEAGGVQHLRGGKPRVAILGVEKRSCPGLWGAYGPQNRPLGPARTLPQKPGSRPPGPAFVGFSVWPWTGAFPNSPPQVTRGEGPRLRVPLKLVRLHSLRFHEPRQVGRERRVPTEDLGVSELLGGGRRRESPRNSFEAAFAQQ